MNSKDSLEVATPNAATETEADDVNQIVTFQIGEEEYSFDILDVREIIRPVQLTRIPLAPYHVKGVANLRGDVLPVLDLHKQFGIEDHNTTDKTRILVVDHNEKIAGLYVDAVHQVTNVQASQWEDTRKSANGIHNKYLKSVAKLDNGKRIVLGLDPDKVCEIDIDQSLFDRAENLETASADTVKVKQEETFIAVTFESSGVEYYQPIEGVQEIIRIRDGRPLANSPDFIKGILSLRGEVIPILDLRSLLGRISFESQKAAELQKSKKTFSNWADEVSRALLNNSVPSELVDKGRQTVDATSDLRSSNDQLSRAYDALRLSIQAYSNSLSAQLDNAQSTNIDELSELSSKTEAEFENCTNIVATASQDDQKIIVIRMGSFIAGLQVDVVKEVRAFPKSCLEAPPSLAQNPSNELSGIIKLNGGKRMILKLDAETLVGEKALKALSSSVQNSITKTQEKETMNNESENVSSDEIQLVCFKIGDDEYASPIEHIREIDRISDITAMPEAPNYIDGITNLRGEVLTVVSLRKRFEMEDKENDDKSRIIVVDIDGAKTGLRVDSVSHVIRISQSIVSGPPKHTSSALMNDFITGIAKAENGRRIIILVDLKKLLTHTDTTALST